MHHSLINGNVLHIPLASQSFQCAMFSPPYWALRDYGTGVWHGGHPDCDHQAARSKNRYDYKLQEGNVVYQGTNAGSAFSLWLPICPDCGATREDAQLGLEAWHDCLGWATQQPCGTCFICNLRTYMRGVHRVLRDDGLCFLNIGDKYADSDAVSGLKRKDLALIPERTALALQVDGWYIRKRIIWEKPNAMPESIPDRPSVSHEHVWMMSKQEHYFSDMFAVREPVTGNTNTRGTKLSPPKEVLNADAGNGHRGWVESTPDKMDSRNLRDVLTIATQNYRGAHYATYPEALAEVCIKMGTSEKGRCRLCGAPWKRILDKIPAKMNVAARDTQKGRRYKKAGHLAWSDQRPEVVENYTHHDDNDTGTVRSIGWEPTCTHHADTVAPCLVFDPFCGSGTTLKVCKDLGLNAVGLDLSLDYLTRDARRRINTIQPALI